MATARTRILRDGNIQQAAFVKWETRAGLMLQDQKRPAPILFSTVTDGRIISGLAWSKIPDKKEQYDPKFALATAFDIWDVENDAFGQSIWHRSMPHISRSSSYKGLWIERDMIGIPILLATHNSYGNYVVDGCTYAFSLKNNPTHQWNYLPFGIKSVLRINPSGFLATYHSYKDRIAFFDVKQENTFTLHSNETTIPQCGGAINIKELHPLSHNTAISLGQGYQLELWKLTESNSIEHSAITASDPKEKHRFRKKTDATINKLLAIDSQKIVLSITRTSVSSPEKKETCLEIIDIKTQQITPLLQGPTTTLLLSNDQKTLLHYAAPLAPLLSNGFTLFDTHTLKSCYFGLPDDAKPIGFLSDARVVCDLKSHIAIFNLKTQNKNYQIVILASTSQHFVQPILDMIMEFCGDLVLPHEPDYVFSSKEFLYPKAPACCSPSCTIL